jgi:hypothetical protein
MRLRERVIDEGCGTDRPTPLSEDSVLVTRRVPGEALGHHLERQLQLLNETVVDRAQHLFKSEFG